MKGGREQGMVANAYNSSIQESEAGGLLQVQSQLGLREIVTQQTNKQEGSEKHPRQPGEMAPQVKMFAAKPGYLSSVSRTDSS